VHRNLLQAAAADSQQQPPNPFTGCAGAAPPPLSITTRNRRVVFSQFDVETTEPYSWFLPQHFALPLFEAHSSLWILNSRGDANDWSSHVLHWYSTTRRLFRALDLPYYHEDGDEDNNTTTPLLPSSPLSQHTMVDEEPVVLAAPTVEMSVDYLRNEFDRSLARAANVTEHRRRHNVLVRAYEQHTAYVTQFAQRYGHALLHVNVDENDLDDPATASTRSSGIMALVRALRLDATKARQCWKFNPQEYGADWQDFSLKL
jgi:hypothetical protein